MTERIPEDRLLRMDVPVPEADLYVLKNHTELALSYAGAFHGQGIAVCNEYGVCLTTQDKVTAGRLMQGLHMPAPETWLISNPQQATELLTEGPLIIRPHRGHHGAGLYLVKETAQLISMQAPPGPLIAQRYVPGPGEDLKVYVAGESVWAMRRPSDPQSFTRFRHSVHADEEVRDIAVRIHSGSGLELFGCNVIESPDDPRVVDVSYFPGYKGCPNPAPVIAATIDRTAHGS